MKLPPAPLRSVRNETRAICSSPFIGLTLSRFRHLLPSGEGAGVGVRAATGDTFGGEAEAMDGGNLAADVDEVGDGDEAPSVGNLTPTNPEPSHVYSCR